MQTFSLQGQFLVVHKGILDVYFCFAYSPEVNRPGGEELLIYDGSWGLDLSIWRLPGPRFQKPQDCSARTHHSEPGSWKPDADMSCDDKPELLGRLDTRCKSIARRGDTVAIASKNKSKAFQPQSSTRTTPALHCRLNMQSLTPQPLTSSPYFQLYVQSEHRLGLYGTSNVTYKSYALCLQTFTTTLVYWFLLEQGICLGIRRRQP